MCGFYTILMFHDLPKCYKCFQKPGCSNISSCFMSTTYIYQLKMSKISQIKQDFKVVKDITSHQLVSIKRKIKKQLKPFLFFVFIFGVFAFFTFDSHKHVENIHIQNKNIKVLSHTVSSPIQQCKKIKKKNETFK